ncbi:hypothetical protein A4D02_23065 [Niastella koreensis]|uniref:Uncharacterized protein n=2 Tax=Niastella koreensis TaxID=354356 RepID=G8TD38_NIAKG|nr:hypothetical protein [Niastella koreensis]AEV98270.1 hypothetical protein Niako_1913 [Niastella koreensis GR20-10]OQP53274.1 hypothetical protein A4D02_23065 [Niastella koreensis]
MKRFVLTILISALAIGASTAATPAEKSTKAGTENYFQTKKSGKHHHHHKKHAGKKKAGVAKK